MTLSIYGNSYTCISFFARICTLHARRAAFLTASPAHHEPHNPVTTVISRCRERQR